MTAPEAHPLLEIRNLSKGFREGGGFHPILAGAQAGLAAWHETRAQLHQALGEQTAAMEQQRLALTRRRIVGEAPQIGRHVSGPPLAETLLRLAALLVEAGDPDAAAEARREARELMHTLGFPAPQS